MSPVRPIEGASSVSRVAGSRPALTLCLLALLTPPAGLATPELLSPPRPTAPMPAAPDTGARAPVPGDLSWRNVGPSNMMGRISAIDALEEDHRTVLVGTASGGVWKSTNAGTTFRPIFEDYGSQSIGDVKFFQPDPEIIWVGTGEATNRNSVGWGDGVYRSTDGGESFTHVGLQESHQVGEIAVHPRDPDVAYVAVPGDLWSHDGIRGLYKTEDGGESWRKLAGGLPEDGRTGAIDVEVNPRDPDVVYAGFMERIRRPWTMQVGGPHGGIYKSTDGGESWRKLTGGLPGDTVGMVDVDLYHGDPDVVVAFVGAPSRVPRGDSVPGPGVYRSEDGGESWTYQLRHTSRPHYHGQVRIDPTDADRVYLVSRYFMYTDDGGESWKAERPFSAGGGDDHDLWISPRDGDVIYMATDQGAHLSQGGGGHLSFTNMAIGQYYEIGLDMRDPYWIYGGLQDNGGWAVPNRTRNRNGVRMDHAVKVNGGDGFHMAAAPAPPGEAPTVYTTAHVGYFGRVDMATRERENITPTPATTVNFREVYDPAFPETPVEYTINPGEYWLWYSPPDRAVNGSVLPPQFRWNWNSPLALSPHDPETVYVAGNHVFRSRDRGETWEIISPDLTDNEPSTRNPSYSGGTVRDVTGAENHHTVYALAESPARPGVIWAGTDDGRVQVTVDAGDSWREVTPGARLLPEGLWVSHVEPSHHDPATAYVAVDGHRSGDTRPYVFRTADYGESWTKITAGLPDGHPGGSVHVVVEDHREPELLFAGTEFGAYVSLDGGDRWRPFMNGLPPVAVRDLEIHPREDDLVAGTHGRSLWVVDDISPLRVLTASSGGSGQPVRSRALHVFENPVATRWLDRTNYTLRTSLKFNGENPPHGAAINFWVAPEGGTADGAVAGRGDGAEAEPAAPDSATVVVEDTETGRAASFRTTAEPGVNRAYWELSFEPAPEDVSRYRARLREVAGFLSTRLGERGPGGGAGRGAAERGDGQRPVPPLDLLADDLLEPQRYPESFDGVDYPTDDPATDGPGERGGEDDRRILAAHLEAVRDSLQKLDEPGSWRELNGLRSQLEAFSSVAGDTAFLGLYPAPLREAEAPPGRYRVRVEMGSRSDTGSVRLREDPLKGREERGGEGG